MKLVNEMNFKRLGVFTYSQEEDKLTTALIEQQIDEDIQVKQQNELLLLQKTISLEPSKKNKKIRESLNVLIEEYIADGNVI